MYSDDRFCAPCCNKGLFQDGENYCTQCKNYLCLPCAKAHGQICAYNARINIRHSFWSDDTKDQMTCLSEKNEMKEVPDDMLLSTGYHKFKTHDRKSSDNFRKKPSHLKSRRKENYTSGENESVPDEGKQLLIQKTKEKRQKFSARGGTARVIKISLDVERVKLQRCGEHPEHAIENFCNMHNDLCCEKCLYENHDRCIIQPIDEVAHGIFARDETEKAEKAFKDLKEKNTTIAKKCEIYLDSMQQNSQRVNSEKTEKEGKETNVADRKKETNLKRMQAKCNELDENISIALSEIQNAKESGSEVFTFVALQKNKKTFMKAKAKLQELAEIQSTLPQEDNKNIKQTQTNTNVETRSTRETTGKDVNRKVISTGKYLNTANGDYISSPDETENKDIFPNKTVIGEVILHAYGEHEKEQSQEDKMNNHHLEIQEVETIQYEEGHDNDLKHNKYETSENLTNDVLISTDKTQPIKKNVLFLGKPVTSSVFRKPFKDRVKTYGLVTEYYLNDDDDDILDGIRVLRLQSAPPERLENSNQETALRPKSMNVLESRKLEQWQNRKMLESVEYKNECNEFKEMQSPTLVNQGCTNRTATGKNAVKSTKAVSNDKKKLRKQYDTNKRKIRLRRENTSFPYKKSFLLKKMSAEPISTYMVRNYEPKTEAQRLKQWIKQTEEINRKYKTDRSEISTKSAGNEVKETDGIYKVHAANVNDKFDVKIDEQELQTVPLMTKEATIIKIIHPDGRQSSAKSRTSDSEESLYNNQTYAHRPKSQLLLTDEQIIRLPDDERVCEINSITCMPDGRIVVSDYSNMAIKMFRVGWGKSSVLALDEPPHDITVVSNSILAVISGLAYDRLLVVSVGQFLSIKKRFKTGCVCKAISSYESHIYLLCLYRYKTEIRILTIDGIVSFRLDLGHAIPSPKSIALKASDGLIYILDQNGGIFSVKMGKIVSRSFDRNIESYLGVEVDINNNLFICTKNPCGIYELNYDGKHLMPILLGYGMENIKAIAYNVANNNLVVGCANSETIQIYKINDTVSFKKN